STNHRACGKCGAPWQRCIEKERRATRPGDDTKVGSNDGSHDGTVVGNRDPLRHITDTKTVGWQPSCGCFGRFVKQAVTVRGRVIDSATSDKNQIRIDDGYHSDKTTLGAYRNAESHEEEQEKTVEVYQSQIPLEQHPVVKCLVLDPFSGSGTTMLVSHEQGVGCVGVELSKEYFDMTVERLERHLLYPKYRAVQIGPPEYDPFSDA
ncbi:MAG: hypothetical protein KGL39_46270, partial [Patescibacteria group bacterium]|nr:hypothetical protein [Patescibacteria group bacterium]